MPYKVEDVSLTATAEATLNKMEKAGWALVTVIPSFPEPR